MTIVITSCSQLLSIFAQKKNPSDQADITAIVFVQERNMASALASLLIKMTEIEPDKYDYLKVNRFFMMQFCKLKKFGHSDN